MLDILGEIHAEELALEYRATRKASLDKQPAFEPIRPTGRRSVAGQRLGTTNPRADMGSNNWLVSGKKTMSGFPIVVGDPTGAGNAEFALLGASERARLERDRRR